MKFTLSWLKKFIETDKSLEEICDAFNKIGHEVEEVVDNAEILAPFIVGEILSLSKHPDADKLNICQVFDGQENRQVICGASNVSQGIKIVLARPGDKIPSNNLVIKKAKIRGVESHGMICSAEELGLEESSEGIMILQQEALPGTKYIDIDKSLSDPMIHLSITPNRSDCLGVYGLARDLAAFGIGELKEMNIPEFNIDNSLKVDIDEDTDCSAFSAVIVKDVSNKESPEWMQNLLRAVGVQPKNFLVDVTNYINYSFARPLHVFDLDKVSGGIHVRNAKKDEVFHALDGKEYKLCEKDVVVADEKNVQALGGIIGGELSKSELSTTNILIESAVWDAIRVSKSASKHHIDTDSKHRFERGVDTNFTSPGMLQALSLIIENCGGEISSSFEFSQKVMPKIIEFNLEIIKKIAGLDIKHEEALNIMKSLGCKINDDNSNVVKVEIPSWRHDLNIPEDLVEEVLRIYGYDNIPSNPIFCTNSGAMIESEGSKVLDLPYLMGSRGYHEVITWSFMSSIKANQYGFDFKELKISNPISQELDVMRPSILPNLIDAIEKNNNRGIDSVSIFEIGNIYQATNPGAQTLCITALRSGYNQKKNIFSKQEIYNVFDIKEDLISVLSSFGYDEAEIKIVQSAEVAGYLHPTQSAQIILRGREVGKFGALHPLLVQEMNLSHNVVYFELNLDEVKTHKSKFENIISNYQKVDRDFAFIISDDVPVGDLISSIRNIDKKVIRDVNLFDVYKGKNVDEGQKSVAFNVVLQSEAKGLDSNDIESYSQKIIDLIEKKFNGILRDK